MKNVFKLTFLMLLTVSLFSCKNTKGDDAKVSDAADVATTAGAKTYAVSTDVSKVMWEGSKPTGSHNGTINVSEGAVEVKDGKLVGGNFVLDMNSITVLDLEGDDKAYLEGHLKGSSEKNQDDFFNVAANPTAKFEITKVTGLQNDNAGNYLVYGNLTMKNVTKEVGFKANVDIKDDMVRVSSPQFKVDRTLWGIKYGSPTFFEGLKDKAINNDMGIKVNLVAKG